MKKAHWMVFAIVSAFSLSAHAETSTGSCYQGSGGNCYITEGGCRSYASSQARQKASEYCANYKKSTYDMDEIAETVRPTTQNGTTTYTCSMTVRYACR